MSEQNPDNNLLDESPEASKKNTSLSSWLIILLPSSVVLAGIAAVVFIYQQQITDVPANYYKAGIEVNQVIDAIDNAKTKNIRAQMNIDDSLLQVFLESDQPISTDNLLLDLRHPLDENLDLQIRLIYAGNNTYRGAIMDNIENGRWYLDIYPQGDSPDWMLKGEADIPNNGMTLSSN